MTLKVVIQCAGSKNPDAGFWKHQDRKVIFVAEPARCSKSASISCYRPDDAIPGTNKTWRQELEEYNQECKQTGRNPCGLCKAYELYKPKRDKCIYKDIVETYGERNVFILSAGWGLVRAGYLLPNYDITFAQQAESWKRRRNDDEYRDFNQFAESVKEDDAIYFFGGKDYLPLYYQLTWNLPGTTVIYYWGKKPVIGDEPRKHNYKFRECPVTKKECPSIFARNWYYICAKAFVKGKSEK